MSWGKKITILYTGFVVLVLAMVFFSFTMDVNLVEDDYYASELKYQDHIDNAGRTIKEGKEIDVKLETSNLILKFPLNQNEIADGTIHLYRPSDSNSDKIIDVALDENNLQIIDVSKLQKGLWKVKVNWEIDSVNYFTEKIITLN